MARGFPGKIPFFSPPHPCRQMRTPPPLNKTLPREKERDAAAAPEKKKTAAATQSPHKRSQRLFHAMLNCRSIIKMLSPKKASAAVRFLPCLPQQTDLYLLDVARFPVQETAHGSSPTVKRLRLRAGRLARPIFRRATDTRYTPAHCGHGVFFDLRGIHEQGAVQGLPCRWQGHLMPGTGKTRA